MTAPDRTAQILDRLAEMDLTAAEHVHAQLLAATEPKAVAELARAYQRAGRALRQVLMLKMKRDEAQAAQAAGRAVAPDTARDRLSRLRLGQVEDAVARVAAQALADRPRQHRETLDRLDVLLDDWWDDEEDRLLVERLDDLVLDACRDLDLPQDLARRWEDLPPAAAPVGSPAPTPPIGGYAARRAGPS